MPLSVFHYGLLRASLEIGERPFPFFGGCLAEASFVLEENEVSVVESTKGSVSPVRFTNKRRCKMKAKIISQMLLGVAVGLGAHSLFGDGCYVHSSDWQGGYWDDWADRWQTVENGFVVQSGGYYWCCKYTSDGEGVSISGIICGRNDDGEYTYYSGVYADQWDVYPKSASENVSGNLSIPSYVYGKPVVEIGNYALDGCDKVTGVTIPSSVTNISRHAFSMCTSLATVTIPSSVRRIGKAAFNGCSKLRSISIPSSVEVIEDLAFSYCSSLATISCPATVELGEDVFAGCEGLRKNGMIIAGGCLWDASGCVGEVVIPNDVKRICRYAFCHEVYADDWDGGCKSVDRGIAITVVTLPDSVVSIDEGAFYTCYNLKSINLPVGLKNIGDSAFFACKSLKEIDLPDELEHVGRAAFNYCTSLTRVFVPANLKSLGMYAFGNCKLDQLVVAKSSDQWNLSDVLWNYYEEEKEDWYDVYDYWECSNSRRSPVEEVVVIGGEKIGNHYFAGCDSVEKISLSADVRVIGEGAFEGCSSLRSIIVPSENTTYAEVDGVLFSKDKSVLVCCPGGRSTLTLPETVICIAAYAFHDCSGLTSLEIPNGVTNVGSYAFYGCSGLSSLMIPNIASIDEKTFYNCSGLTELKLPTSLTSIGWAAMYGCSSLSSVTIPSSVVSIGYDAFSDCRELKKVWVDNGDSERIKGLLSKSGMNVSGVTFLEPALSHLVTFDVGVHGTRIGGGALSQMVNHGEAAEAPLVQADYGWEFGGWNCVFGIVTNDLVVVAQWNRLILSAKIGNETWTFHAEGDGVVIGNAGNVAVTGNTNGSLVIPEELDGKTVVGLDGGAFAGLAGLRSVVIPSSVVAIGKDAFAGCAGLDTIKVAMGDANRVRQLVLDSGLDVSWVEFRERDSGTGPDDPTSAVCLTITNIVVNYIVNSVQPEFVLPATSDTGFVNIIAEVKGGGVAVPATWTVSYPKFTEKFGSDFTKALAMKTGKKDGAGNDMFVWQDYVAGTDPTKEDDVFTASITIVDGEVKVSYTPELDDARKALRKYTTWGKAKLTDKDWSVVGEGEEGNFNFFKVTVEMK